MKSILSSLVALAMSTSTLAGDTPTPRVVIEFFVSVDNDLSYLRSSGTSTLTLNSASNLAPHRSVIGLLIEDGPIAVVVDKPDGEILKLV